MSTAIVFSRDRAAQLDLLLQSLAHNAPDLFKRIVILFTHSSSSFRRGYQICMDEHDHKVLFIKERDFRRQVLELVGRADKHVAFLCDDDILYRWMAEPTLPETFLSLRSDVLCVSLRLGKNTKMCYPLNRAQAQPRFTHRTGLETFKWAGADGDWGYPGSLDGHVFRKDQLRYLLSEGNWDSPNTLEDHLNQACRRTTLTPFMACYPRSLLVGNPVNRVQSSHPNRVGQMFPRDPFRLNEAYLAGRRLRVQDMVFPTIRAAHVEVALEAKEVEVK